jgi:hypothetical protein
VCPSHTELCDIRYDSTHTLLFGDVKFPPPLLSAEDILRSSGVPFAIVRPTALTEEPRGMPLEFSQGDTIKASGPNHEYTNTITLNMVELF